jgi:epoxide hydrolase-like predicted phosphatase
VPQHPDGPPDSAPGDLRAVITDWGGVFTSPIADSVDAWLAADLIDPDADNPIHQLERGEGDPSDFERALAAQLVRTDGAQVQAAGLLNRMFAAALPVPEMYELMRTVRQAGFRTCLLSNSWGPGGYPLDVFPELFDAWVISAEVGMRKPEERIFRHAAGLLELPPEQCVFIDDLEANIDAAAALGMTGVHHREPPSTAARLAALLNLPLG